MSSKDKDIKGEPKPNNGSSSTITTTQALTKGEGSSSTSALAIGLAEAFILLFTNASSSSSSSKDKILDGLHHNNHNTAASFPFTTLTSPETNSSMDTSLCHHPSIHIRLLDICSFDIISNGQVSKPGSKGTAVSRKAANKNLSFFLSNQIK